MMESPRKRSRPSSHQEEASPPTIVSIYRPSEARARDKDFWFDDGNLILVAQGVEFRVYKGPLIKHSPVFRDMLSLPQPARDNSTQPPDHVPVIYLTDHPSDIKRLLQSFIFGNELRYNFDDPDFNTISSIVRMGHKYQIDGGVDAAMEYLQNYYPSGYENWLECRTGAPSFTQIESIGVVNLARLTDSPQMLPAALLQCCALSPDDLREGFIRGDGVCEKLLRDDLERVLIARAELIQADARAYLYVLDGVPHQNCLDISRCKTLLRHFMRDFALPDSRRSFTADWTTSCMEYVTDLKQIPCDACMSHMKKREAHITRVVWNKLPNMLGIEQELKGSGNEAQ